MKTSFKLLALTLLFCTAISSANAQTKRGITGSAPVTVIVEEVQKKELRNWELTLGWGVNNQGDSEIPCIGLNYYMRRNDHFNWILSGNLTLADYAVFNRFDITGGIEYRKGINSIWDYKAEGKIGLATSQVSDNAVDLFTTAAIGVVYNNRLSMKLQGGFSPTWYHYNSSTWELWSFGISIGYYIR